MGERVAGEEVNWRMFLTINSSSPSLTTSQRQSYQLPYPIKYCALKAYVGLEVPIRVFLTSVLVNHRFVC